jgi:hypothetical protein
MPEAAFRFQRGRCPAPRLDGAEDGATISPVMAGWIWSRVCPICAAAFRRARNYDLGHVLRRDQRHVQRALDDSTDTKA